MQDLAAEMNLSETAFVTGRPDGDYDLRWFTPTVEVDLCGHATLASAHVLGGSCRFHTRSGPLTCRPAADGRIEMEFPAITVARVDEPPDWSKALGTSVDRIAGVYEAPGWVLVELASADDVRAVAPDRDAILELGGYALVTAAGDKPGVDSVCRMFGPAAGIDEDPVTGSAHCVLAPFWADRLGRDDLVGEQVSRRGGTVGMRLEGDRVVLIGQAVTVFVAQLLADAPAA
jgi:predicted PhzF superfamily epimerase YddE/YHI9